MFDISGSGSSLFAFNCDCHSNNIFSEFLYTGVNNPVAIMSSCDFSGCLVNDFIYDSRYKAANIQFKNCRMPASFAFEKARLYNDSQIPFTFHNCDNNNTTLRLHERYYNGMIDSEFSIYRTAGARDENSTHLSLKVVSEAEVIPWARPLRFKLASLRLDTSSAKTLTVHFAQDGATTPLQDDEAWIEVSYPDDTTAAYHWQVDRAADIQATPVNQADSSEAWTGLSGTNKRQKLEVTTSETGKLGPVEVWLCLAKPSTALYACPAVEVS